MLTTDQLEDLLTEYVERYVPAMLASNYHLTLVKGGPEYSHLPEQSHLAHIVNGIFGLAQLVRYFIATRTTAVALDEPTLRKVFALFTVHEVHKDRQVERLDSTEFSVPLAAVRERYERLGLDRFVALDDHILRAANTHKRSNRHGDLLLSDETDAGRLWLWVRIADTLASVRSPEEAADSLRIYLEKLGPAFMPKPPLGKHGLYYHHLPDLRGVLTNSIHRAVAAELQEQYHLFPLLYFATGALYIGPLSPAPAVDEGFIARIADRVLDTFREDSDITAIRDAIRGGLRSQKFDFETYVYAVAGVEQMLDVVHEDTLAATPKARTALDEIDGLVAKRKELGDEWRATVEERFGITLLDPKEHKTFNEHWSQVRRYLLYVDTLLRDLAPDQNRLEWFLQHFSVPPAAAANLRQEAEIWGRGGIGKYVLIIGYHFLRGPAFTDRPAEALPLADVLERLHHHVLAAFSQLDTHTGRQNAVGGLGFRQELEAYLAESLHLSFDQLLRLTDDGLAAYLQPKSKGHTRRLCSLCNRASPNTEALRTGILEDFGRVFSNRVLPAREAPEGLRLWCPLCQLEFILRKLAGMGLPGSAHYNNSRRIYLYLLPTFSFTPDHLRLFNRLFQPFVQVTNLSIRDYGPEKGIPHRWLLQRSFDPDWIEDLQSALEQQAAKIAGWGGRNFVGERLSLGRIADQRHYYLITWEKAARDGERDDARIATRTEAWAKALFAATILAALTSCKLYVTERPYLPISDPAGLPATITLDSPPPILQAVLGERTTTVSLYGRERGPRSHLEQVLDLSAALWLVTAEVHASERPPTKDKQIAARLHTVSASPLAGATFYKEYGRLNDGKSPSAILATACHVLLEIQNQESGGKLMDVVEALARKSLEIGLPRSATGRGKAHRFELVFREGVSAMRKAQQLLPELRKAAFHQTSPSEETIAELKRLASGTLLKSLERRRDNQRGDITIIAYGAELGRLVGEFMDLLIDEIYLERSGGSFARFLRLENALADGIYYYTDRHLSAYWSAYQERRRERQASEQSASEQSTPEQPAMEETR